MSRTENSTKAFKWVKVWLLSSHYHFNGTTVLWSGSIITQNALLNTAKTVKGSVYPVEH